jgi:hypothetical protein
MNIKQVAESKGLEEIVNIIDLAEENDDLMSD